MPISSGPPGGDQVLYESLRHNYRAFIMYFHGKYMEPEDEVPDIHVIMFDRMVNSQKDRFVGAIPRDHAKTTIAKLVILWFLMYENHFFPLYVSDTHPVAAEGVSDVWDYLTSEEYIALAGEPVEAKIERRADGYFQFKMRWFPADNKADKRRYKTVNMLARGAKQQIRGTNKKHQRPDLLVMDDMETEEIMGSDTLFKKFKTWCYGELFKALRTGRNKKIQIGNLISHQSLLQLHLDNESWDSMRYGVLIHDEDGDGLVPLWPERWSLQAIKEDHQDYANMAELATWYAEMMNLPYNPDSSLVDLAKIQYVKTPDPADNRIIAAFLTVDPAISTRNTADKCAIVVNLLMDDGTFIHAEVYKKRGMNFTDIYRKCVELSSKWFCNLVFVEDVAFQRVLLQIFSVQVVVDALELEFVGCPTGQASKLARLSVWAGMLQSGAIKLSSGDTDFSGEIANFDRTKKDNKDDVMDAGAQVPIAMSKFAPRIYESRVSGQQFTSFKQEAEEGVAI